VVVATGQYRAPMTCDSCGADEPVLYGVHRMYVTPADWDTEAREITLPEVEQWCFACCTHYPHRPVDAAS
jgi:hypothetical protein